jgi:hypothetical protein
MGGEDEQAEQGLAASAIKEDYTWNSALPR